MQKELKLKLLPNNQVSVFVQWVNRRKGRYLDVPDYSQFPEWKKDFYKSGRAKFERDRAKTHETIRVPFYLSDGSIKFRLIRRELANDSKGDLERDKKIGDRTLDIIKKSQRKTRNLAGWGERNTPKRFTNKSGQRIREVGAMMDKSCYLSSEQASCTTLTLPGNYPGAFDVIARYSGYIINRLFQIIRRETPIEPKWFFVWEYQKRGALHLHLAHFSHDPTDSQMIGAMLIEQWHKILVDVSEKSGICLFTSADKKSCAIRQYHQHHTQPMRKSCGAYFSKYASKSENSPEGSYIKKFSADYPPSRFWGSSISLKEMCKKFSYEEILATGEMIEERHQEILELILLHNPVKFSEYEWERKIINKNGWKVTISEGKCQTFYLRPAVFEELIESLRQKNGY